MNDPTKGVLRCCPRDYMLNTAPLPDVAALMRAASSVAALHRTTRAIAFPKMTMSERVEHLQRVEGRSVSEAFAIAMTDRPRGERDFHRGEVVALSDALSTDGRPVWIQVAKTGSFLGHSAGPFELNDQVFREIIANFRATVNRRIPIDYEHASEADSTSGTIPVTGAPAQGWITDLKIEGGNLWGLVEWLPQAREQIRAGQYRYLSPAIRFGTKDRVTGKPAGAKLSSAALTNVPFLDSMQPLAAKDGSAHSITAQTRLLMIERGMGYFEARDEAARRIAGGR